MRLQTPDTVRGNAISIFGGAVLAAALGTVAVVPPTYADRSDYIWNRQFEKKLVGAKEGDVRAQYELANMYLKGQGTSRDPQEAFKWFQEAAGQGYVRAEHKIGYLYYQGEGVPQNDQKALEWFRKAAENGYAPAQFYMGKLYASGSGVSQDYEQALTWYTRAHEKGYYPAKEAVAETRALLERERERQRAKEQVAASAPEPRREKQASRKRRASPPRSGMSIDEVKRLLVAGKWQGEGQPAAYLPSSVNRCEERSERIVCRSQDLRREEKFGVVTYQVEAVLGGFNHGGEFTTQYRDNVSLILPSEPDNPNLKIPIDYGWQKIRALDCKVVNARRVSCVTEDDKAVEYTRS